MNKLVKTRKLFGLTQNNTAELLGVSLRTYQRYEAVKTDSKKILLMSNIIEQKCAIDEEHGILKIESIISSIEPILIANEVGVCFLFGSYAKGTAKGNSDIDLLVDINPKGINYFTLIEELRTALHKKVDLITVHQLTNSPDLLTEILKSGEKIYERKQ